MALNLHSICMIPWKYALAAIPFNKSNNYLNTSENMDTRNLTPDYFPVFQDLSDDRSNMLQERLDQCIQESSDSPDTPVQLPAIPTFHLMFNATEVIEESFYKGFTVFQTAVLLVKNAFEGHMFMTSHLRPHQLFETGTILLQNKNGSLVSGFYEKLDHYLIGLNHAWDQLKKKHTGLDDVSFESLVYTILINQLIRISVKNSESIDVMQFKGISQKEMESLRQRFELMKLGEHALGELLFIERIDSLYKEKFSASLKKLHLKEGILSHYERKREMSYNPNIKTEEELDAFVYECFVKYRVKNNHSQGLKQQRTEETDRPGSASVKTWLNNRIRFLYRAVSKNCCEIHNSMVNEPSFHELNRMFMSANSIYNDAVFEVHETLIKYMRMVHLFAEITVYRKTHGLDDVTSGNWALDMGTRLVFFTPEILKDCSREFDEMAATMRAHGYTDFKLNNILADDMAGIHQSCLDKELDFIDEQIIKIQQEIKDIMKMKSGEGIKTPDPGQ